MYYFLNYVPTILQIIIFVLHHSLGIVFSSGAGIIYVLLILFITPIYLLFVNGYYLMREFMSYPKSIIFMASVIVLNMLMFIIEHKIKTGYFIGDVPEGIYYLMVGIPTAIILIGMLIIYFLRK